MSLIQISFGALTAKSMTASAAAATEETCVSEAEGAAIKATLMPDLANGLGDKCMAHLPANAYLVRNGKALASR